MRHAVIELNGSNAGAFQSLAGEDLQPQLDCMPSSWLVLGAVNDGEPSGLAVVSLRENGKDADVLSLVVAEGKRRQGIGQTLLQESENIVRRRGYERLLFEFLVEGDRPAEVHAFLAACGVEDVKPGIHIFSGPTSGSFEVLWVDSYRLPDTFSIGTWSSVTQEERSFIEQGHGVWYPPNLSPFLEEELADPDWSLVLRYKGEIAGWLKMEPFDAETVLFKTLFVQRRHQRAGRGIALMVEIGRRFRETNRFRQAILFVEGDNEPMVRFMYDRLDHSTVRKEIMWRGHKELK
jgi:GNAT superfamily N-acetyltransferase